MAVSIVRLGSPRLPGEGLRIGTVRRPPRGVPKDQYSALDFYDVWLPNLAPSAELLSWARKIKSDAEFARFACRYRAEMSRPENLRIIDLLAALSRHADFSVGCYCLDETRCHRSILKQLLKERGALLAPDTGVS